MRIAFLVHGFPVLSETFILNQVTGLIDAGHEVEIFASGSDGRETVHTDIDRYRLLERTYYGDMPPSPPLRLLKAAGRIARNGRWRRPGVLLRALNVREHGMQALSLTLFYASTAFLEHRPYDIIHCQFATLGSTAAALRDTGAAGRASLVVSFRGADLTVRGRISRYGTLLQKADLFLPVCEAFRAQLIAQGCDPRKIHVLHSGIKVSRFPYTERPRPGDEATRVLVIGRLVEKKGVAYAIRAIARLKRSGRPVRLTVVGDGPLRGDLDRLIEELQLGTDVHMAGPRTQDEVLALLRNAHLLVAPSVTAESGEQEGIPNVLKEAMATGIPVVSTRHSGIPELITDGVSGLLVPERDADALADRLAFLIDHPERWGELSRAGRERIETKFDSDKLNDRLIALYEHVAFRSLSEQRS